VSFSESPHWEYPRRDETIDRWRRLFACREEAWQSGKVIFRQGDAPANVYLLTKGLVILTWDEPNGSEGVFGLRFPGQVIDLCAHGLGRSYAVSARTAGQTRICKVPLDTFNKAHDTVEVAQFFEHILQVELYNAARFIVNLKTATPADRFLRFLCYFAVASGQAARLSSEGILVPLRDYQLAELMGLSPRHFERVKGTLQRSGVLQLKGRRQFVVHR
jgi:CRP-like cAMP-binding protein